MLNTLVESLFADEVIDPDSCTTPRWFVYLFVLKDGSAFEVGFCNTPLHRLRARTARFHELFDLSTSVLLNVSNFAQACEIEANLKQQLSHADMAPSVSLTGADGSRTDWFDAAQVGRAREVLASVMRESSAPLLTLAQVIMRDLFDLQFRAEVWAFGVAKQLNAGIAYAPNASHLELARCLRDCLDAYRALRVPLFATQSEQGNFVWQIARLYRPALTATL